MYKYKLKDRISDVTLKKIGFRDFGDTYVYSLKLYDDIYLKCYIHKETQLFSYRVQNIRGATYAAYYNDYGNNNRILNMIKTKIAITMDKFILQNIIMEAK